MPQKNKWAPAAAAGRACFKISSHDSHMIMTGLDSKQQKQQQQLLLLLLLLLLPASNET